MKTRIICIIAFLMTGLFNLGHAGIVMGDLTKAQRDSLIFAFPNCTPGSVYMKDGSIIHARLNYNFYESKVLFINDKPEFEGDTLRTLDNLNDILLIEIGDRSFVPVLAGTGLGEIVLNNRVKLIVSKKVNITEKKTGAYGTSGSTSSSRKVSGFTGNGTSGGNYSGQTSFATVAYDFENNAEISIDERLFLMKEDKLSPLTKKTVRSIPSPAARTLFICFLLSSFIFSLHFADRSAACRCQSIDCSLIFQISLRQFIFFHLSADY